MSQTTQKEQKKPAKQKRKSGNISAEEISVFCAQAAMLLKAGIPLHQGLYDITETSTKEGKTIILKIAQIVEETGSLYQAVEQVNVFPHYMVQMINIGETAGKLETVLESLSSHYDREDKLRTAVRSAIVYPVILILLMAVVVGVLVIAVLPVFDDVLTSMGADIAGTGLMSLGGTIGKIALIFVAVLLGLVIITLIISLFHGGRNWLMRVSSKLPVFKKLYNRMASSRFASVMGMMLSSGFEVDQALEMASRVVTDNAVKEKIARCRTKMENGMSFADALMEIELFSGLYARMVQTGETAGQLDDVMEQLAERYNGEVDQLLNSLIAVIEPTMVIILSVIIGAILLSVMLPLINIMKVIG